MPTYCGIRSLTLILLSGVNEAAIAFCICWIICTTIFLWQWTCNCFCLWDHYFDTSGSLSNNNRWLVLYFMFLFAGKWFTFFIPIFRKHFQNWSLTLPKPKIGNNCSVSADWLNVLDTNIIFTFLMFIFHNPDSAVMFSTFLGASASCLLTIQAKKVCRIMVFSMSSWRRNTGQK